MWLRRLVTFFGQGRRPKASQVSASLDRTTLDVGVSSWAFDREEGRLDMRGWVASLPPVEVAVRNASTNKQALAITGLSRPDVAKRLGTGERDAYGFHFSGAFAWSPGQRLEVYASHPDGRTRRIVLLDRDVDIDAKVSVEACYYDSMLRCVCAAGRVHSVGYAPTVVTLSVPATRLVAVPLGPVRINRGKVGVKWRVDVPCERRPETAEVSILFENNCMICKVTPVEVALPRLERDRRETELYRWARTGRTEGNLLPAPKLPFVGFEPEGGKQPVLIVVHNLFAPERPEKRRALEGLREALRQEGSELVILHHGDGDAGCGVPQINFGEAALQTFPADHIAPVPPAVLDHCDRLLYGFHSQIDKRPKSLEECRKTVRDQHQRLRAAIAATNPRAVLLWHQWNSLMTLGRELCLSSGIPSFFIHEGMLPGTMTIDAKGMMAEAECAGISLAETVSNADLFVAARQTIQVIASEGMDRKPQSDSLATVAFIERMRSNGRRIILYAGSNDWQSGILPLDHPNAKLHGGGYEDSTAALAELVRVAAERDIFVIHKPHPNLLATRSGIEADNLVEVFGGRSVELVRLTDATVTLVSSLSYISMSLGKPTVLMGANTLSGSGAVFEAPRDVSLGKVLDAAMSVKQQAECQGAFVDHVAALLEGHLYRYGEKTNFALLGYEAAARKILGSAS